MEFFKKRSDTIVIICSFILCFWILNEKINVIEKDLILMKNVLVTKNIMLIELAIEGEK